ncbi:Kidins220, partial [Symbiodinium microadriaticum]
DVEVARLLWEAGARPNSAHRGFIALTGRHLGKLCRSLWSLCSKPIAVICSP